MNDGLPDTIYCYPDCRLDNTEIQHGLSYGGQQLPGNDSEPIVVAVGSAAPLVFDRMCVSDPRMCSRLRPCGRRLVSADSSPLLVQGELDMTVGFPDLNYAMILIMTNIGSEGLLGTEALQSCLPHQFDHGWDNCGRMVVRRCSYIKRDRLLIHPLI